MKQLFKLTLITLFYSSLNAQKFNTVLKVKDDAEKLTTAYLSPLMKGLISDANNGWYTTARVHKKFGFDLTIGASLSIVPKKDESFNLNDLNLNSTVVGNPITSTLFGNGEENRGRLKYTQEYNGEIVSGEIDLPGGIKGDLPENGVPFPSVQIGFGLPLKSEIIVRYLPTINIDNTRANLLGAGIKKEITSWFGAMDKSPLHISLLAAFTNISIERSFEDSNKDGVEIRNASTRFKLNSYTLQAIASLNLKVVNFYGGFGYNSGKTNLDMLGSYTVSKDSDNGKITETLSNPLSSEQKTNYYNLTLGTRFNIAFFKIFASYTIQEYNSINAGIAFSFR